MAEITLGQIAGLIAALGFLVLIYFLIRPLQKLAQVLERIAQSIDEITTHTLPGIDEAVRTISEANSQVQKIDAITDAAARTSADISAMTTLITSTVGAPFLALRRGAETVKNFFAGKAEKSENGAEKGRAAQNHQ